MLQPTCTASKDEWKAASLSAMFKIFEIILIQEDLSHFLVPKPASSQTTRSWRATKQG
jgi:hypothetical protein